MPLFDKTKDNFTKEQMRERIRHERRIEFAGEGWYYMIYAAGKSQRN